MDHIKIASDNYVAFTFFIGTMAMMAASVFFFFEVANTEKKWRTSVLVSSNDHFLGECRVLTFNNFKVFATPKKKDDAISKSFL